VILKKEMRKSFHQKGQVIIILLLVMVVSLAVALSIVGRSINEISTSKKTEDSSRAFSAAEAGIEKVLKLATPPGVAVPVNFPNLATASAEFYKLPVGNNALEHPPIGKPSFAQFWFADPDKDNDPLDGVPDAFYGFASGGVKPLNTFNIYFGIPQAYTDAADKPAIEIDSIVWNTATATPRFESRRSWIETEEPTARGTNFTKCTSVDSSGDSNRVLTNNNTIESEFYCKHTISYASASENIATSSGVYLVMARVRILYSSLNHPVAVKPTGNANDVLPPQANIYKSTGEAGEAQRVLQVFRQREVMPHFFDFVLFSEAPINK